MREPGREGAQRLLVFLISGMHLRAAAARFPPQTMRSMSVTAAGAAPRARLVRNDGTPGTLHLGSTSPAFPGAGEGRPRPHCPPEQNCGDVFRGEFTATSPKRFQTFRASSRTFRRKGTSSAYKKDVKPSSSCLPSSWFYPDVSSAGLKRTVKKVALNSWERCRERRTSSSRSSVTTLAGLGEPRPPEREYWDTGNESAGAIRSNCFLSGMAARG